MIICTQSATRVVAVGPVSRLSDLSAALDPDGALQLWREAAGDEGVQRLARSYVRAQNVSW